MLTIEMAYPLPERLMPGSDCVLWVALRASAVPNSAVPIPVPNTAVERACEAVMAILADGITVTMPRLAQIIYEFLMTCQFDPYHLYAVSLETESTRIWYCPRQLELNTRLETLEANSHNPQEMIHLLKRLRQDIDTLQAHVKTSDVGSIL